MSLGIVFTSPGLNSLNLRLAKLGRSFSRKGRDGLLRVIGQVVEGQTRDRIGNTKTAPDGKPWPEWSEEYAGSKHGRDASHTPHPGALRESGGHSLLVLSGDLIDSIQRLVNGDEITIGSNLPYAARQNKMRTYIGLSTENKEELRETIDEFLDAFIGLGGE